MAGVFRWFVGLRRGNDADALEEPLLRRLEEPAYIRVENRAPANRRVAFRAMADWDEPLPIWTDIFVADRLPDSSSSSDLH
jgi:hypothetical protein